MSDSDVALALAQLDGAASDGRPYHSPDEAAAVVRALLVERDRLRTENTALKERLCVFAETLEAARRALAEYRATCADAAMAIRRAASGHEP